MQLYFTWCGLMSLFRGPCLARLSLEAGASSAVRSRAGALERELTALFQAAQSITPASKRNVVRVPAVTWGFLRSVREGSQYVSEFLADV